MLRVEEIETIRRAYHIEKRSIRAISREQGHHRRVIREAIVGTQPSPRRYRQTGPRKKWRVDVVAPLIDAWLQADQVAPPKQRVFQIACGYEDQNDADSLRDDPLLKLVCGRLPESGPALAGQSTFSRLENSVDRRACRHLAHALLEVYLVAREQDGVPRHILLDIDSTDDPTHGHQEGTAYHGYYRQHQYYPLLVFDGETDQLITAILRPGTVHGSRGVISVLRMLVQAFRQRWPGVQVEIRADAAGATPRIYRFCERHQITSTLGLGTNARLAALAAPLLAQAQALELIRFGGGIETRWLVARYLLSSRGEKAVLARPRCLFRSEV